MHVQKKLSQRISFFSPKDFLNESYTDSENTQQATKVFKEKNSKG